MSFVRLTIAAALVAVLPLAACGASNGASSSGESASALATSSGESLPAGDTTLERRADHARVQGSEQAPLWIVEVSDFQCPYCASWHAETYPTIVKEFVETGKVRLAYINFPIQGHRNAWPAAEAAMCAAAQGRFWPMHDAIFDSQRTWEGLPDPAPVFDSLATKVGLELGEYRDCVSQHETRALIQADIERARESGVGATPTFIIGSESISGAQPAEAFRRIIAKELQAKSGQGS